MKTLEYIIIGQIVLISVSVFFALINYLGGYGAIIASCIVAGLANWGAEQTTDKSNN